MKSLRIPESFIKTLEAEYETLWETLRIHSKCIKDAEISVIFIFNLAVEDKASNQNVNFYKLLIF